MLGWGWLPTHAWLKELVCNKYSTSPAAFGSETLTSYASFRGVCRSKSCTPIMPPSATVNDLQQLHQNFQHGGICCIKLNLIWSLRESKRFLAEISPYFLFLGDLFVLGTCHRTSGRTPCSRTCWAMAHQTPTCMWQGFLPVPVKRWWDNSSRSLVMYLATKERCVDFVGIIDPGPTVPNT